MPYPPLQFVKNNARTLRAYLSLVGGSAGRLILSLAYFVAVANTLSLGDFGLFATASSIGVVLSRVAAFGFVSPLYRIATVKPRLLGVYSAGLLAGALLSLPLVTAIALSIHVLLLAGQMPALAFAAILLAEIVLWRGTEIVIIVLNGLNRFAAGAMLLILGMALRAGAAVGFALFGNGTLDQWSLAYLTANGLALVAAVVWFFPRTRLRWRPELYLRRWVDAVSVGFAEVLFYLQSELDKTLVLAVGGAGTAGLYALVMRLVDLTALPVRAALTLLVQRLMRSRDLIRQTGNRVLIELAVAAVSTAGIAAMAVFLWLFPTALGENVAVAAPLVGLVLAVPAFRNLIEYHSELLYATGRTVLRAGLLGTLGVLKALLLGWIVAQATGASQWAVALNAAFLPLYAVSALLTYRWLGASAVPPAAAKSETMAKDVKEEYRIAQNVPAPEA